MGTLSRDLLFPARAQSPCWQARAKRPSAHRPRGGPIAASPSSMITSAGTLDPPASKSSTACASCSLVAVFGMNPRAPFRKAARTSLASAVPDRIAIGIPLWMGSRPQAQHAGRHIEEEASGRPRRPLCHFTHELSREHVRRRIIGLSKSMGKDTGSSKSAATPSTWPSRVATFRKLTSPCYKNLRVPSGYGARHAQKSG